MHASRDKRVFPIQYDLPCWLFRLQFIATKHVLPTPSATDGAHDLFPAVLIVGSNADACSEYQQCENKKWHAEALALSKIFRDTLEVEQRVHFVDCRRSDEKLQRHVGDLRQARLVRRPVNVPILVVEVNKALSTSRYSAHSHTVPVCPTNEPHACNLYA